jgi:hypothetical protein
MALVMLVIEGEFLLAMGRVLRVIQVQDNRRRRFGVTGNEVIDERLGEPVDVLAIHTVLQPREGRSARQGLRGIQRYPLHAELKHGIVPETIGIIAIRIAGGELIDPLREQVTQRMISIRRMALVVHRGGQALCQADLAVDPTQ